MNQLSELVTQSSVIELEKHGVKVNIKIYGWEWDVDKGVNLTGSATWLEIILPGGKKINWLIDFGMFQGCENELKYNEILPFDIGKLSFVIVTHTHLDHIGKLLFFSKPEFKWNIWTTKLNKALIHTMLADVIKLQPENPLSEADKIKQKIENLKKSKAILEKTIFDEDLEDAIAPIELAIEGLEEKLRTLKVGNIEKKYFDTEDLLNVMTKINSVDFYEKFEVANQVEVAFIKAGHLPWSAQVIMKVCWKDKKTIVLGFSGDLWKIKKPAIWGKPDISKEKFDFYMIESTYAGRNHPEKSQEEQKLIEKNSANSRKRWKDYYSCFYAMKSSRIVDLFYSAKKTKKNSRYSYLLSWWKYRKNSQLLLYLWRWIL